MTEASVVLPAYNNEETIEATLDSVIAQTSGDWELWAVDDGSRDGTRALLEEYARKDARIRVLSTPGNQGAGPARNLGIGAAGGRFVAFLDADDLWHPEKLERQVAFMKERGCIASFTYYRRRKQGESAAGREIGAPGTVRYRDLLKSNWIPMSSAMYDRLRAPDLRMRPIRRRQDYLFWLDLLKEGGEALCLPECLMTYTIRARSVSSDKLASVLATWRLYRDEIGLPPIRAAYYFANNLARAALKRM